MVANLIFAVMMVVEEKIVAVMSGVVAAVVVDVMLVRPDKSVLVSKL